MRETTRKRKGEPPLAPATKKAPEANAVSPHRSTLNNQMKAKWLKDFRKGRAEAAYNLAEYYQQENKLSLAAAYYQMSISQNYKVEESKFQLQNLNIADYKTKPLVNMIYAHSSKIHALIRDMSKVESNLGQQVDLSVIMPYFPCSDGALRQDNSGLNLNLAKNQQAQASFKRGWLHLIGKSGSLMWPPPEGGGGDKEEKSVMDLLDEEGDEVDLLPWPKGFDLYPL